MLNDGRITGVLSQRTHDFRIGCQSAYLAATNELMLMNIDYQTRRSAPWPDFAMERIEKLAAAHATLPRPAQAGRLIGIKKK